MMAVETRLVLHTREVVKSIEDAAAKRMAEATNVVRNEVLVTLSGKCTGRVYLVPGTKRKYIASAPGEPPAQATSGLRQSIKTRMESRGKQLLGFVGTEEKHGKRLEFGTKKMKARPWLRISFEKALNEVKAILSKEWF